MEKYAIEIEKVANGYILTDLSGEIEKTVIEEPEDDAYDVKAAQKLLYAIMNHFDLYGSKHDEFRVRVIIEGKDNDY
jgi:hypothetical protein